MKLVLIAYLCGMVLIHAGAFWQARKLVRKGYPDFTIYYGAATMLRWGLGHELYNGVVQFDVQRQFAPDVATRLDALPYNHPPFEALFFVPFTYLPYFPAFVLWDLVNVSILVAVQFLLRLHVPELREYSWPLWILASLAFFPIFFTLLQGQDSILLLLLYTLAFFCLKRNAQAMAGAFLAIGLFKPQMVLPFVLLWMIRSGRRILYGFVPTGAVLVLVSCALVGTAGLISYPAYVFRLENTMARGAILPSDMPNLRGVAYLLTRGSPHSSAIAMVLSGAILLLVAWQLRMKESTTDYFLWKFVLAMVTTALVSYHCLGYDLSILLLPIALIVSTLQPARVITTWPWKLMLSGIGLLFFSPLELFLLLRGNRLAVMGCAVLLLFVGVIWICFAPGTDDSPSAVSGLSAGRPIASHS